jgi:hypothetical protein
MKLKHLIYYFILIYSLGACATVPEDDSISMERIPTLKPDYSAITIPFNIAPLNFFVEEKGDAFFVVVEGANSSSLTASSKSGKIQFNEKKWKKLLEQNRNRQLVYTVYTENDEEWRKFQSFNQTVAGAEVDPFLYYRLLHPGYESWTEISIVQRNLSSFQEKTVVKNSVLEQNCVNCHSFTHQNAEKFLFHVRGSHGGTYFWENGDLKKVNLKTREMKNGAVYPRWHPSGNYVAFSSNKVVQQFHAAESKKIEVSDLNSSLVMYDTQTNEMMDVPVNNNEGRFMDTYPEWSPDGKYLYFCRAEQIGEEYNYEDIEYDLYRVAFEPENREFGEVEKVFAASDQNASASFPRISPNGKSLVFTMHDYGCFPIWHKEADLYNLNLDDLSVSKMSVNSSFTESYHSWSSNGSWLIFSSKRGDGLSARPYISWVDENGNAAKPFVVPQEDPLFYSRFIKTYNIPEFATAEVSFTPGQLRKVAVSKALQAEWADE